MAKVYGKMVYGLWFLQVYGKKMSSFTHFQCPIRFQGKMLIKLLKSKASKNLNDLLKGK